MSIISNIYFFSIFSCSIRPGAETWKSTHISCNATKHTESRPSKSNGHRIRWSTEAFGSRFTCTYGNLWIYTWKGHIDATTRAWLPQLFIANDGEFYQWKKNIFLYQNLKKYPLTLLSPIWLLTEIPNQQFDSYWLYFNL